MFYDGAVKVQLNPDPHNNCRHSLNQLLNRECSVVATLNFPKCINERVALDPHISTNINLKGVIVVTCFLFSNYIAQIIAMLYHWISIETYSVQGARYAAQPKWMVHDHCLLIHEIIES